ncbi:carbohydrate esterase family 3 protein [Zasmidium cellare ATCC 36951]|uniref:Carbohydrate esterase family 3 protein n=1 Tax=Zasmidium cellare ATCC 36951 TaxID=1080233 RepID=A0A6A6CR74_ZASCE|nr:carbohydrate esterase family 3 protein [Zasmidium cellare ATCC 36951]KAF2167986.1 carbohydrate esterase family 3 protein [Zasmidium cellare ATCC 36951]
MFTFPLSLTESYPATATGTAKIFSTALRQIGFMRSGTMANNQNDGFPGWTISEIALAAKLTLSLAQCPNVILLHAGTNDMNNDPPRQPYNTAPERLGDLLDELLSVVPETTIIVAQIIQSSNAGTKDRIPVFNDAVPDVVAQRTDKGAKVQLVDLSSIGVDGVDLVDGLHPNDTGYNLMANFWLEGLQQASDKGWITSPQ